MLNMHRPSDQAKLLFFALLRGTVSALATEPKAAASTMGLAVKNGVAAGVGVGTAPFAPPANIQLRLARRADVPSIQKCNLATLPENYNSQFYVNHLRQWPDLCLVAEDTMASPEHDNGDSRPFGSSFALGHNRPESNVVAYVLGKVEERAPRIPSAFYSEGYRMGDPIPPENEGNRFIGHVTSLAVLQPYRRQGLAAALMRQLHFHLEEAYGAGAVGLHVRKSNQAACRLYQDFGYQIDLTIPGYYQDGEDAYFMKKPLQQRQQQAGVTLNDQGPKFPFLGRKPQRPWESGPLDLRLPRALESGYSHNNNNNNMGGDPATARDEQNPGLLTGSM